jgi:hypothetical protein
MSLGFKPSGNNIPRLADVEAVLSLLEKHSEAQRLGQREKAACKRAKEGLRIIRAVLRGEAQGIASSALHRIFGKDFGEMVRRVVTNSFRTDIHFLPHDGQRPEWTVIQSPSIALFRYPLTIPIDLLDEANASSEAAWPAVIDGYLGLYPGAGILRGGRPIKYLRVRERFVPDLISRFTSLYIRIGSPDFTEATVDRLVTAIGEAP